MATAGCKQYKKCKLQDIPQNHIVIAHNSENAFYLANY